MTSDASLPTLFALTPAAAKRTLKLFTTNVRNPNTRRAYMRAVTGFGTWCSTHGLQDRAGVSMVHAATYIEQLQGRLSAPRLSST